MKTLPEMNTISENDLKIFMVIVALAIFVQTFRTSSHKDEIARLQEKVTLLQQQINPCDEK